jgi:hypothetical protein
MHRWRKALVLVTLAAAASACEQADEFVGPDEVRYDVDTPPPPPPPDTSGRWGGYVGSGG